LSDERVDPVGRWSQVTHELEALAQLARQVRVLGQQSRLADRLTACPAVEELVQNLTDARIGSVAVRGGLTDMRVPVRHESRPPPLTV
jgi:hypothetical protein